MQSILSSFGLQVGLWRHEDNFQSSFRAEDDINFVMLSYEVGFEKPKSEMFDITKQMLPGQERYLHIGDGLHEDYYAAKRAGWEAILLDREVNNGLETVEPVVRITNLQELTSYIR